MDARIFQASVHLMDMSLFVPVESLRIVQEAESLSDEVWKSVRGWDWFEKHSIGMQLARSCDSVGANLVEGLGRHHGADALRFCYIARGSLKETTFWLRRARTRRLICESKVDGLLFRFEGLLKALNLFISKYHPGR